MEKPVLCVTSFEEKKNAFNENHKRNKGFTYQITVFINPYISNGGIKEGIVVRFYETDHVSYCVVWISKYDRQGFLLDEYVMSGKSSVIQANRNSEAAFEALKNGGFTFNRSWRSAGEAVITEALTAVVAHLELDIVYLHKAHG